MCYERCYDIQIIEVQAKLANPEQQETLFPKDVREFFVSIKKV